MLFLRGCSVGFFRGDVKTLVQDMQVLKPDVFPSVPRLANRLYDKVGWLTSWFLGGHNHPPAPSPLKIILWNSFQMPTCTWKCDRLFSYYVKIALKNGLHFILFFNLNFIDVSRPPHSGKQTKNTPKMSFFYEKCIIIFFSFIKQFGTDWILLQTQNACLKYSGIQVIGIQAHFCQGG